MELIFDLPEVKIYYDSQNQLAKILWTPQVSTYPIKEGIKLTRQVFDELLNIKPKKILQITKDIVYPFTEEYQEFVAKELTPRLVEIGTEKIAYVLSKDMITSIGLQMLNEKAIRQVGAKLKRAFFNEEQEALKWLTSS